MNSSREPVSPGKLIPGGVLVNRECGFSCRINLYTHCSGGPTDNDLNQTDINAITSQDLHRLLPMDVITDSADHGHVAAVDGCMTGKIRRGTPESFFIGKQVPEDFSQRNDVPWSHLVIDIRRSRS
jgi:hypothetical protein